MFQIRLRGYKATTIIETLREQKLNIYVICIFAKNWPHLTLFAYMLKTNGAHASVRVDRVNTSRKFALQEHNVVRPENGMYLTGYYYYQDCLY